MKKTIKLISSELADQIIDEHQPEGLFYLQKGEIFIGIDNSTGDAWVEEFGSIAEVVSWLNGEFEASERWCPFCGRNGLHPIPERNALSRKDNKTLICDTCARTESLKEFFKHL